MRSPKVGLFNDRPAVRVAHWPGGVSLWRTGLDRGTAVTFEFRSKRNSSDEKSWSIQISPDQVGTFWLPSSVYLRHSGSTPAIWYLRWAMVELGLVRVGERLPLGDRPFTANPFVGRFRAETRGDLFAELEALDRQIFPGLYLVIGDELFKNRAMIHLYGIARGLNLEVYEEIPDGKNFLGRRESLLSLSSVLPWFTNDNVEGFSFIPKKDLQDSVSWLLLPGEEADRWWAEHTVVGELDLPAEEVETYRLLGEQLPFLWDSRRLLDWASERGGRP